MTSIIGDQAVILSTSWFCQALATIHSAMARRSASFVDKILKGTKPGDIPFEQATKLELVVNLKAAKGLGLTVPQSVLVLADGLGPQADLRVRRAQIGVHVRELSLHERIEPPRLVARALHRPEIHLARFAILAEVVEGDRQVERGLGVSGVYPDRRDEAALRLGQLPARVIDDAEHVPHVGQTGVARGRLTQTLLGGVEIVGAVVLAPERDQPPKSVIHAQ